MESYTVIGRQHKVGTYNGINFDNLVFSCVYDADEKKGEVGKIAVVLKVKSSLLSVVPDVGDVISPVYDRFGHIIDLR